MRPEILTLKNIGPFSGTHTVNFTELGSIFLVYGKTGAGKTTLFDALSYAFYGEAPGDRKGLAKDMRSHFASDGEESAVQLSFVISGNRYRIRRTLPFDKIGTRSGKIQNVAEEVTLESEIENEWKDRSSTNKGETDKKIRDLIGLSQEEFSRIVLLPQGEFAQFLKQNSNQRKEVLSKLFPVEKYRAVTELARVRAREMTLQLQDTEKNIMELRERFNALTFSEDHARAESETESLRVIRTALRQELGTKSALFEQARAFAEKKSKHTELRKTLAELEHKTESINTLKNKLNAARRAEPLIVSLGQVDTLKEKTEAIIIELADLDVEIEQKKKELAELENETQHIATLLHEKEKLVLRKEQLRVAVEIAETLEIEMSKHEDTRKKTHHLQKDIALRKEEQTAIDRRLTELKDDLASLDTCTAQNTGMREKLENERQLKILADETARERLSINAHEGALRNATVAVTDNKKDRAIAEAENETLLAKEKNAQEKTTAHELTSLLKDGVACPVCGSKEHPAPAIKPDSTGFTASERIVAGKRRIVQLVNDEILLEKKLSSHEADLENARMRLSIIVEKYCMAAGLDKSCITCDAIPSPEESTTRVREASSHMQKAADDLSRAQKAFRETEELRRKKTDIETEITRMQDELTAVKTIAASEKSAIEHKQNRYREAFPTDTSEEKTANEIFPDPSDASDALEQSNARILIIEANVHTHETKLKDIRVRLANLEGTKTELIRNLAGVNAQYAMESQKIQKALVSAGFADGRAVHDAAFTTEEILQAEGEITSFGENYSGTQKALGQIEKELSLWTGPDEEKVALEISDLNVKITENDHALEAKTASLASLESLKARHDELETERATRSASSGKLASLANDLTGKNQLNTSFDAWILGMYLEEIASYANERLEKMSEGRYRIGLNENYRKGNRLSGLDLEIRDAYTGKSRPSGTLSGGETFMASISLALGLADSIQSRSGGIQLDAVFIDEGFGSLDESSLERAIGILDEIRGSRMVGIISHVSELRTRIPNRIEIIKTGAGSTIQKETYND